MKVLVTGAKGFIGRTVCAALRGSENIEVFEYDLDSAPSDLPGYLQVADVVVHLAGVNRPESSDEYWTGNAGFTADICGHLLATGRSPKILLSSSIQAEMDNPYGASKLGAEEELRRYCAGAGAEGVVFRLKNLFGKWCRPNYNSATATFCYNVAHDLPVEISDPVREIDLTYIDDVVDAIISEIEAPPGTGFRFFSPLPSHAISLGQLAALVQSFRDSRSTLVLPDFADQFVRRLYATYLTYLDECDFSYSLDIKSDNRGCLAEVVKSPGFGQIFVSRTKPGITRGNHHHHTKTEKFIVVEGEGVIRFRRIDRADVIEYAVSGKVLQVVDIPPGYTHSIENVGDTEMVTLFWASEPFDPQHPDTYYEPVTSSVVSSKQ